MGAGLLTDLYELNMAASYLARGMVGPATFSLFFRNLPVDRGFLVAAGVDDALDWLETFAFSDEDLAYLGEIGFDAVTVDRFAGTRFTGDVWAVAEGEIVAPGEPVLEVTAPAAEAQLVETMLLNQVTFQTAIATKAARCRLAAGPDTAVVDFAFRRTHGVDAAMAVARLTYMTGFAATSNVEAARRYGLQPAGTMAHSFIEAFEHEADAFAAFAADHPAQATFLVDTYDTLTGVRRAIDVIRSAELRGTVAVRLDSGDLVRLAIETRRLLDDAGLDHVRIFASGGIDEFELERLRKSGAPIDAFGVGTQMGVSADAPVIDSVYKLVQFGNRPVMKLSAAKETLPGPKQVFRRSLSDTDVIARRDEPAPAGHEPLLRPVMASGRRLESREPLESARSRVLAALDELPAWATELRDPQPRDVRVSTALESLAEEVRSGLR